MIEAGVITLSVNPQLKITYDEEGKVLNVYGLNDDGKKVLSDYTAYEGKDTKVVIKELVKAINVAGYFVQDVDGYDKDIVIQIKNGSKLPNGDDDYFDDLKEEVVETIKEMNVKSDTLTIDDDDYDDKYETVEEKSEFISLDKAKEIATKRVGLNINDVVFTDKEYDFDDNRHIYELEFSKDGVEYELDIDAKTGQVIKHETDNDIDDNDDLDDIDENDDNDDFDDYDYDGDDQDD